MTYNFVSVSGVSNLEQLKGIGRIIRANRLTFPVVIGYQLSQKSINEGTTNPRQPKFSDLARLTNVTYYEGMIPSYHYFTRDPDSIVRDLEKIAQATFSASGFVQLNTLPPELTVLGRIKQMGFRTILPIAIADLKAGGFSVWKGEGVEDVNSGDVEKIVSEMSKYSCLVDYFLFDPSHGTKLPLDLRQDSLAIRLGKRVRERATFDQNGLIYAGGLGPHNVRDSLRILNREIPKGVGIDTESAIRDTLRVDGKIISDTFNLDKVEAYLVEANKALEE